MYVLYDQDDQFREFVRSYLSLQIKLEEFQETINEVRETKSVDERLTNFFHKWMTTVLIMENDFKFLLQMEDEANETGPQVSLFKV